MDGLDDVWARQHQDVVVTLQLIGVVLVALSAEVRLLHYSKGKDADVAMLAVLGCWVSSCHKAPVTKRYAQLKDISLKQLLMPAIWWHEMTVAAGASKMLKQRA